MYKSKLKKKFKEKRLICNAIEKKPNEYKEFLKLGGAYSGVYDISKKSTAEFVKKYRKFIPKGEIYKRDKRGWLVPIYKIYS